LSHKLTPGTILIKQRLCHKLFSIKIQIITRMRGDKKIEDGEGRIVLTSGIAPLWCNARWEGAVNHREGNNARWWCKNQEIPPAAHTGGLSYAG
jgi:hypothetical protein